MREPLSRTRARCFAPAMIAAQHACHCCALRRAAPQAPCATPYAQRRSVRRRVHATPCSMLCLSIPAPCCCSCSFATRHSTLHADATYARRLRASCCQTSRFAVLIMPLMLLLIASDTSHAPPRLLRGCPPLPERGARLCRLPRVRHAASAVNDISLYQRVAPERHSMQR